MGFFDFLKKKESSVPVQPNDFSDLRIPELGNIGTDMPPITAPADTTLPSQPQIPLPSQQSPVSLSSQPLNNMPSQPQIPLPSQFGPESVPIDFTLPSLDDLNPSAQAAAMPAQGPMQPASSAFSAPIGSPIQAPAQSRVNTSAQISGKIDVDLDKLFLKDESWKEPDMNNFEPYHYEKIDPPSKDDFGRPTATLPDFNNNVLPQQEAVRVKEPPVQLFVRGDDYKKIFSELENINSNINTLDPRLNFVDSLVKGEDEEYVKCKDYLDFMYKKMVYVDKKIFMGGNYG